MTDQNAHRYSPRSRKAAKIAEILRDAVGHDLGQLTCIDIGCATGEISNLIAPRFKQLVGVEFQGDLLEKGHLQRAENATFVLADGSVLPFPTNHFDVGICAQVYEHAPDQPRLASEIWRVLKPGGVCFFSGPNRLALLEEHYWIPLLSWLPRRLSNLTVQMLGMGDYYDSNPLTLWQLRSLWRAFHIKDYTVAMLYEPERFSVDERLAGFRWIESIPRPMVESLAFMLPNYNWALVKPG